MTVKSNHGTEEDPHRDRGTSLLELLVSMSLVVVVSLGVGAAYLGSQRSHRDRRADVAGANAVQAMIEQMRNVPFSDLPAQYQGRAFEIPDIGGTGTVWLYLDETASGGSASQFGLPRDLDGDGFISSTDVSANALLLPVEIALNWMERGEARNRSFYSFLSVGG